MFVTARSAIGVELEQALEAAGLVVDPGHDALVVDGRAIELEVVERGHPHPAEVRDLVEGHDGPALLVADRISESGRAVLRTAGWSWFDRRGHLRLWVPGLRVDADVAVGGDDARGTSASPWTTVGLELALHALCHPDHDVTARRVAPVIGRSAGGTQEVLNRFTEQGLIGRSSRLPLLPDLFWETAAHWPDDGWVEIPATLADVASVVGPDALVRVDERAATLGGARIAAAADLPARAYVASRAVLRAARNAAGAGADDERAQRALLRVAPVRWIPELDGFAPDDDHPWRVAHPIVCALRLAADPARGREIVEDWGVVPEGGA